MIFADSDNEWNSKNGNYVITIHIAISKKRHMANPKIHKTPPFLFQSSPPFFPYPPIYTKKFRTLPLKQFFPTSNPPILKWGISDYVNLVKTCLTRLRKWLYLSRLMFNNLKKLAKAVARKNKSNRFDSILVGVPTVLRFLVSIKNHS